MLTLKLMQTCLFLHVDNGPAGSRRTGTATVFVEVQDVNDNRPIFLQNSYETSILESVPQGTSILQVKNTHAHTQTCAHIYCKTHPDRNGTVSEFKTQIYFLKTH